MDNIGIYYVRPYLSQREAILNGIKTPTNILYHAHLPIKGLILSVLLSNILRQRGKY